MDAPRLTGFERVRQFTLGLDYGRIPPEVRHFASLLLLDTLGVAAAAKDLQAGRIARELAARSFGAGPGAVRMLFDGRFVSRAGAAFAAASQIDNLDAHDGYNPTKGHIGVVVVPALFVYAQGLASPKAGDMLSALVAGYEVGARAAIALHGTVSDYHSSGAWNALAVVATGARLRQVTGEQLREAFGIAEYHGPRGQMMRVIDNPTMVHDGSAFGALAGATALDLAEMGFTGAPAITVEAEEVDPVWRNLGETWAVSHHYMKPYPVCRWTHALIDGALLLKRTHAIRAEDIAAIELTSFHEATRLYREVPATTPVAQYAVSFPVASALVKGRLGVEEIAGAGLLDPEAARLVAATTVREADRYNERFPAGRWGDVTLVLKDGRRLNSGELNARGGPDNPMAEDEILAKFHEYAEPVLGVSRSRTIEEAVRRLADPDSDATGLIELVCRA